MTNFHITILVSGSVAAYKACELCRLCVKAGWQVQFVLTEGGSHFVGTATLEALSGRPVYTDLWARRESMTHISVRKWTDLYVYYPATANRINQMAAGLAPDLAGAVFLANNFEKPFWIAPAMNSNMLAHPATQQSIDTLQAWGARFFYGQDGTLACGDQGGGRLIDPETIFAAMTTFLTAQASAHAQSLRLLLSGGPMTEPIDAVRYLGNSSSGRTSLAIATHFAQSRWLVDFVHHQSLDTTQLPPGINLHPYTDYRSFATIMEQLLARQGYHGVIQAAAVSDYHVKSLTDANGTIVKNGTKIESQQELVLHLEPNPKFLPRIRSLLQNPCPIAGFKLTATNPADAGQSKAIALLAHGDVDLVVWNDYHAYQGSHHPYRIFGRSVGHTVHSVAEGSTNQQLAAHLQQQFEAMILPRDIDHSSPKEPS